MRHTYVYIQYPGFSSSQNLPRLYFPSIHLYNKRPCKNPCENHHPSKNFAIFAFSSLQHLLSANWLLFLNNFSETSSVNISNLSLQMYPSLRIKSKSHQRKYKVNVLINSTVPWLRHDSPFFPTNLHIYLRVCTETEWNQLLLNSHSPCCQCQSALRGVYVFAKLWYKYFNWIPNEVYLQLNILPPW